MPDRRQRTQQMKDSFESEEKFDDLKKEIERLTRELDCAISENIQSARCGLALLEEKCTYQTKCVELEVMYDHTQQELEAAQQALRKLAASQKATNENGIEQEINLLNESAAMESSFTIQVLDLENEVKQLRRELQRVAEERDHYGQEMADTARSKSKLETEMVQLRQSLKELKQSQGKITTMNSELEEENYVLQRELSRSQTIQTELKMSKCEINRLLEQNFYLHEKIKELRLQTEITETRLDETVEDLKVQREMNKMLRKEAEVYACKELMLKSRSLADSILEIKDIGGSNGSLFATSFISRSESTNSSESHHIELLPQVFNELKQLRKLLEDPESVGKSNLRTDSGNETENKHQFLKSQIMAIDECLDAVNRLETQMGTGGDGYLEETKEHKEILNDKVRSSDADLGWVHRGSVADAVHILHNEVLDLKEKLRAFVASSCGSAFNYVSETTAENLVVIQNTLIALNEQLLRFGGEIYAVDGQSSTCNLFGALSGSDTAEEEVSSAQTATTRLKLQAKSCNLKKQAVLAQQRFTTIGAAVHHMMDSMKNGFSTNPNNLPEPKLLKRVDKLEKLLSRKEKDIATLQAIIKSNKTTAKEILGNIRKKYEEEKQVVNETILKLTRELKVLQDETVVLSGLSEKFMLRCTQYYANADGLAFELEAAEEEKKLLKKILKISINRKVDLQKRLQAMTENLRGIKSDIPEKRKKSVQFSTRASFYE